LSFGPEMQVAALSKMIGSFGISEPVSLAWSLKLSPIAMKWRVPATQGPSRGLPARP
jgi:hypothetical protein